MRSFEEWGQLENMNCRVIVDHALFDEQQYDCDMLQIINDEHRIGVVIKKREIFVYKQNITDFYVNEDVYKVEDNLMKIIVKIFKKISKI